VKKKPSALQGGTFQVENPNDSSINRLTVHAEAPEGSMEPVEAEADGTITNAEPTGGTRQIQYKLEAGEAGWVLHQVASWNTRTLSA
jgi:hypothetical protein